VFFVFFVVKSCFSGLLVSSRAPQNGRYSAKAGACWESDVVLRSLDASMLCCSLAGAFSTHPFLRSTCSSCTDFGGGGVQSALERCVAVASVAVAGEPTGLC
jgi:hypothetical protein